MEELVYVSAINGEIIKALPTVCRSHQPANNNKSTEIFDKKTKNSTDIPPYVPGTGASIYSGTVPIRTDSWNGGYRLRDLRNSTNIITLNANNENFENIDALIQNATDFFDNNNVWTAAEHPNDKQAIDVHWAMTQTYEYFYQLHNRNSYNNNAADIVGYVHTAFSGDPPNRGVYWHYDKKAIFLGDGSLGVPPLVTLDICTHEFAHGMTKVIANLDPIGVEGQLNEGFSDIWAATVENWAAPTKQKWIFGDELGIFASKRDLSNPRSTGNADCYNGQNWRNPNNCPSQNSAICGLYENSTVLSHWYYLLVEGGNGWNNGQTSHAPAGQGFNWNVGSIGWTNASKIVLLTEQLINSSPADWNLTRTLSIQAAQQLYGIGSCEEASVVAAWHAVGLGAGYPPGAQISGPNVPCINGTATYTLAPFASTCVGLSWTITPNDGNVTLSYIPGTNTVDVNANYASSGVNYTLTANLTIGPNLTGTVTKNFTMPGWQGFNGYVNTGGNFNPLVEEDNYIYSTAGVNIFSNYSGAGNFNWQPSDGNNDPFTSSTTGDLGFFIPNTNESRAFSCTYTDDCGPHYHNFVFWNLGYQGNYKLIVSPNPGISKVKVSVVNAKDNRAVTAMDKINLTKIQVVKLYDKMGNCVSTQKVTITNNEFYVDVSHLKGGDIYTIATNDGKVIANGKIIKQ